jgi:hypothetical protein
MQGVKDRCRSYVFPYCPVVDAFPVWKLRHVFHILLSGTERNETKVKQRTEGWDVEMSKKLTPFEWLIDR